MITDEMARIHYARMIAEMNGFTGFAYSLGQMLDRATQEANPPSELDAEWFDREQMSEAA